MCVGPGGERGSREDLVGSPLATVLTPGAPAALPLAPLVGAGVAPAMPTPLCCPGPGGPSGVVWCGVVWCGVVWCAKGAVTRRQWPGCLPTGTGKRAGLCVLCARRVYVCRPRWGEGEPGRPGRPALGDRPHSRSSRCTPSRCGVVWCGVVWCAEGAVTKRQRPGCLPTGTGKRAGLCVLCARCV